jgi:hypothetical protein
VSFGIKIDVTDQASPAVKAVTRALKPDRLNPVVGRSANNAYRTYLFALNASRANKLGGKRSNFYTGAARATHFDVVPDGVIISISQVGIAQRFFGGRITPKKSKYLTIPARAESYGKRAGEFPDLELLYNRRGQPYALARIQKTNIGYRKGQVFNKGTVGGEILFWLVKETNQQPDPTVLPPDAQVYEAIDTDVQAVVARAYARGQAEDSSL